MSAPSAIFRDRFGRPPEVLAHAPGRVNLIGEHTDYNDGLVMPAAIERGVTVAAARHPAPRVRLYAAALDAWAEFPTDAPARPALDGWARYPQGVAVQLRARGAALGGLDAVVAGDLPIGAGLSSSAALEVASCLALEHALEHAAGSRLAPRERALLCHRAEVAFVGVPCGIMDQFAASLCRRGHALFLDCRSLETHHVPLPADLLIAVCDTGVRRSLADSAYAARRRECEEAARLLREALGRRRGAPGPGRTGGAALTSLRDLTPDDLALVEELPEPLRRRARHVVTENARVVEAARALEGGDLASLRAIFARSHQSLRDDYAVSVPALDAMVEAALAAPGCLAARMTGAGFGGAVVALIRSAERDAFLAAAARRYRDATGREGSFFTSASADGASLTVPIAS